MTDESKFEEISHDCEKFCKCYARGFKDGVDSITTPHEYGDSYRYNVTRYWMNSCLKVEDELNKLKLIMKEEA